MKTIQLDELTKHINTLIVSYQNLLTENTELKKINQHLKLESEMLFNKNQAARKKIQEILARLNTLDMVTEDE